MEKVGEAGGGIEKEEKFSNNGFKIWEKKVKSSAHKNHNCIKRIKQQKMKQIIGDLTREKMKQKKGKENQSRK